MIETYNIMQGMDKVDRGSLPSHLIPEPGDIHSKLIVGRVRTDKRKYFFPQHISLWNSLPQDVVMASGLDAFKRGLDRFLEEKSITGCLQTMMGVYTLQASKEGPSKCQMQRRGIRRQVSNCLICFQRHLVGPL